MKTMKNTMKKIDVAALAKVVGGISPTLALTMFCAGVSAVGTALGGIALWHDRQKKK